MKRPKVERKDNTSAIGYISQQIIRPLTSHNFRREAA